MNAAIIRPDEFSAEIGKSTVTDIILENPSSMFVEATAKLSNTLNYSIIPEKFILKPRQETVVHVKFTPTHFTNSESGDMTISTQEIGQWRYYLTGKGEKPTSFKV